MAFLKDDSYPKVPKKVNLKKAGYMDIAGALLFMPSSHLYMQCEISYSHKIKTCVCIKFRTWPSQENVSDYNGPIDDLALSCGNHDFINVVHGSIKTPENEYVSYSKSLITLVIRYKGPVINLLKPKEEVLFSKLENLNLSCMYWNLKIDSTHQTRNLHVWLSFIFEMLMSWVADCSPSEYWLIRTST